MPGFFLKAIKEDNLRSIKAKAILGILCGLLRTDLEWLAAFIDPGGEPEMKILYNFNALQPIQPLASSFIVLINPSSLLFSGNSSIIRSLAFCPYCSDPPGLF